MQVFQFATNIYLNPDQDRFAGIILRSHLAEVERQATG